MLDTLLGKTTELLASLKVPRSLLQELRKWPYIEKKIFCSLQNHKRRFNKHLKLLDYVNGDPSQRHRRENNVNISQTQVFTRGIRPIVRLRDDYKTSPAVFARGDGCEAGRRGELCWFSQRAARGRGHFLHFFPLQALVHVHSASPSPPPSHPCSTPAESNPTQSRFLSSSRLRLLCKKKNQ